MPKKITNKINKLQNNPKCQFGKLTFCQGLTATAIKIFAAASEVLAAASEVLAAANLKVLKIGGGQDSAKET
ncbi:hypothetical protein II898_09165 [bacterium]|nr:hypothetical protein [bacterium]